MAATSGLPQVLVSQQLAATETTQYTGPASSAVKLATATLTNTNAIGGAAVTVSLSVLKSGQTADGTHRVLSGYSLAAGDSTVLAELAGVFLGPGDFISAIAGTASVVVLVVSGVVFS
jgi:hypothetical protein